MKLDTAYRLFYTVLGTGSLANGLWMLLSPAGWFTGIPAGVPDTGPLNPHLVHDLGWVFCIVGIGALWTARNLARSREVRIGISLFYIGHGLLHVVEILTAQLPDTHWLIDLPLTFVPAALLALQWLPPLRLKP